MPVLVRQVHLEPPKLHLPPAPKQGGGGGGNHDDHPPSQGKPPEIARKIWTPPTTSPPVENPALPVAPALLDAPPIHMQALQIGDPFGVPGPPSDGPGSRGGIGRGDRGGIGDQSGPRAGNGKGPGGSYSGPLTFPQLIHQVDPEFSEEARRARFNGSVQLRVVIDENGRPTRIEVIQGPGLGLEEKAIQAVTLWRFRPGLRGGKPVPMVATVDVNFRLL